MGGLPTDGGVQETDSVLLLVNKIALRPVGGCEAAVYEKAHSGGEILCYIFRSLGIHYIAFKVGSHGHVAYLDL